MIPHTNAFPTRLLRACRLLVHLFAGLATVGLVFPFYSPQHRDRAINRWARKLLMILHVHIEMRGEVPIVDGLGRIIAANHISWLDIFLIQSALPVRFVAKSDVREWPILGWLCAKSGTLFIERNRRRHTVKINQAIHEVVKTGGMVGLFPEGTTTLGDQLKKLHSSLFQVAVESDTLLVPIAIRYTDRSGQRSETAAYVDDMSLMQSIRRITAAPELYATLQFAMPIHTIGKNRRELAQETEDAIAALLNF